MNRALAASCAGALLLASLPMLALARAERTPPPTHGSTAILCRADEPGPRLLIVGHVIDEEGRPVAGATVSAYNADARGLYNPPGSPTREPRIRGVAITGPDGEFQMLTVRPGSYPDSTEPAHVHFEVFAPTFHHQYSTVWFDNDPFVTPEKRAFAQRDAEAEVLRVTRDAAGLETAVHTITLRDS